MEMLLARQSECRQKMNIYTSRKETLISNVKLGSSFILVNKSLTALWMIPLFWLTKAVVSAVPMVKVLPEPVTPNRVWKTSPSLRPSTSSLIAVGWSPAGGYGWNTSNGEPG